MTYTAQINTLTLCLQSERQRADNLNKEKKELSVQLDKLRKQVKEIFGFYPVYLNDRWIWEVED